MFDYWLTGVVFAEIFEFFRGLVKKCFYLIVPALIGCLGSILRKVKAELEEFQVFLLGLSLLHTQLLLFSTILIVAIVMLWLQLMKLFSVKSVGFD